MCLFMVVDFVDPVVCVSGGRPTYITFLELMDWGDRWSMSVDLE